MKFEPGDWVEIVSEPRYIDDGGPSPLAPGLRGRVVAVTGSALKPIYVVDFPPGTAYCGRFSIRKVPPDDGRTVGNWTDCIWRPRGVAA